MKLIYIQKLILSDDKPWLDVIAINIYIVRNSVNQIIDQQNTADNNPRLVYPRKESKIRIYHIK